MFFKRSDTAQLKKEIARLQKRINELEITVMEMELDKADILKMQKELILRLHDQFESRGLTIERSNKKPQNKDG